MTTQAQKPTVDQISDFYDIAIAFVDKTMHYSDDGYRGAIHDKFSELIYQAGHAAAITARDQRIAELEAAILRTYRAKGRYHTEQSAKEMFALVNAA